MFGSRRLGRIGIEFLIDSVSQTREHFSFHFRITGTRLPNGCFVVPAHALDHFNHGTVRYENIAATVGRAFHAGTVLIAFTGRVNQIHHSAQCRTNDILRQLGTVFRPIGFHHTGRRILTGKRQTDRCPKVLHDGPNHLRSHVHMNPTVIAFADNFGHFSLRQQNHVGGRAVRSRGIGLSLLACPDSLRTRRNRIAIRTRYRT